MAGEFVIDTPQKLKRKLEMVILFFPLTCLDLVILVAGRICFFMFPSFLWWKLSMSVVIYFSFRAFLSFLLALVASLSPRGHLPSISLLVATF